MTLCTRSPMQTHREQCLHQHLEKTKHKSSPIPFFSWQGLTFPTKKHTHLCCLYSYTHGCSQIPQWLLTLSNNHAGLPFAGSSTQTLTVSKCRSSLPCWLIHLEVHSQITPAPLQDRDQGHMKTSKDFLQGYVEIKQGVMALN